MFLNSLNKELCKDFLARRQHEQLQHRELYYVIKQQLININVGKFSGANIKEMCAKMQEDIKALVKVNQFDSKHNAKICQILTKAEQL